MANTIELALPTAEILCVEDRGNLPYGTKSPEELEKLVTPILEDMVARGCSVILIACNSVTTTIIDRLRASIHVPLVGIEPMIKPAASLSKSKVIAVCATRATLSSARYAWLKETYGNGCKFIEPDCSDWASMIEHKKVEDKHIRSIVVECLQKKADVIVLGCTHYHWIEETIAKCAGDKATVLQPEQFVVQQLIRVLEQLD